VKIFLGALLLALVLFAGTRGIGPAAGDEPSAAVATTTGAPCEAPC